MNLLGNMYLIISHYILSDILWISAIIRKLQFEILYKTYEYPLTLTSARDRIQASAVRDLRHQCTFDVIIQFVLRREQSTHPIGDQKRILCSLQGNDRYLVHQTYGIQIHTVHVRCRL